MANLIEETALSSAVRTKLNSGGGAPSADLGLFKIAKTFTNEIADTSATLQVEQPTPLEINIAAQSSGATGARYELDGSLDGDFSTLITWDITYSTVVDFTVAFSQNRIVNPSSQTDAGFGAFRIIWQNSKWRVVPVMSRKNGAPNWPINLYVTDPALLLRRVNGVLYIDQGGSQYPLNDQCLDMKSVAVHVKGNNNTAFNLKFDAVPPAGYPAIPDLGLPTFAQALTKPFENRPLDTVSQWTTYVSGLVANFYWANEFSIQQFAAGVIQKLEVTCKPSNPATDPDAVLTFEGIEFTNQHKPGRRALVETNQPGGYFMTVNTAGSTAQIFSHKDPATTVNQVSFVKIRGLRQP